MSFQSFVTDHFQNKNGIPMLLGLKYENDIMIGTKNNLTERELESIHKKEYIVKNKDGKPYREVAPSQITHLELRLRYTDNVVCIDVDGHLTNGDITLEDFMKLDIPFLKTCPYTLSRKKKLPHFFFHLDGLDTSKLNATYTDCFKSFKGDLLINHAWERHDAEMFQYTKILPFITWEDLKPLFSKEIKQKPDKKPDQKPEKPISEVSSLLNLISIEYLDNRDSWLKIMMACKKCGVSEDEARVLSEKSAHFSYDGFDTTWNSYDVDQITATEGTLRYYAKLSNPEAYASLADKDEEVMDIKKLIHLKGFVPNEKINEKMKMFDQLNSKAQKDLIKERDEIDAENHYKELHLKSKYFEKFHFKVMSPPCFGRLAYNKISLLSSGEIEQQYENVMMNKQTFVYLWRKSENIRTFENVDFLPYPRECKSYTLNTFNGLKIERVKEGVGNYDILLNHIDILTGHDAKGTDYLLNYLSHLVQRPGELPRVALVFQSEQGVGKNIFFENFAHSILGTEYMLQTAEMDKIIGRFSMINNKLLVIMDETSGKDSFSNSDKIKNIITAEQVAWERKGIDGVNINNCGRYIFFSNNSTPVKIEHSDRRYVVYKCANDVQNNAVYFKELVRYFKDEQIMKAFYDFLMQRDISNWDSINDRPITKAYHDIQSANIPAMANYLTEQIMIFENATPEEKILLQKQSATDLFNHFVSWLKQNGFTKMEYTSTKFGREICEYEGIEKKRITSGNVYAFNYETLKSYLVKKRWMELPE